MSQLQGWSEVVEVDSCTDFPASDETFLLCIPRKGNRGFQTIQQLGVVTEATFLCAWFRAQALTEK
jgi:hypothetical protein